MAPPVLFGENPNCDEDAFFAFLVRLHPQGMPDVDRLFRWLKTVEQSTADASSRPASLRKKQFGCFVIHYLVGEHPAYPAKGTGVWIVGWERSR